MDRDASTPNNLVSEAEQAKRLGICLRTLINWRNHGMVPYFRIGRRILYRPSDVDKILDLRYRQGAL